MDWKEALVKPLLKKPGLEAQFKNLRPISNLQFISKLAERSAYEQTYDHLITHNLIPELQSAFRKRYSTETALLKVQNDILLNMDRQHVTLLVLLDLSAAFDTVNHEILLRLLEQHLMLQVQRFNGSLHTWVTVRSALYLEMEFLRVFIWHVVYLRAPALDPCSLLCTPVSYSRS